MDAGWRFAFGHPSDPARDFDHATGYFSYVTKAGYADGPAAATVRRPRVAPARPAARLGRGGAVRRQSQHQPRVQGHRPQLSRAFHRLVSQDFAIPASDLGRRISVEFDGVFRDSVVWVNGFYLGRQPSGYTGFRYDLTDYLNYGGDNVIAVRVDATMEEGWFYEGAGIYRHVWLDQDRAAARRALGHVCDHRGGRGRGQVTARTTVANEGVAAATFDIEQSIVDPDGRVVATGALRALSLAAGARASFPACSASRSRGSGRSSRPRCTGSSRRSAPAAPWWTVTRRPSASAPSVSIPTTASSSTAGTSRSTAPTTTRTMPAWAWRCPTRCRPSASPG
jgi:beta-galactosidase